MEDEGWSLGSVLVIYNWLSSRWNSIRTSGQRQSTKLWNGKYIHTLFKLDCLVSTYNEIWFCYCLSTFESDVYFMMFLDVYWATLNKPLESVIMEILRLKHVVNNGVEQRCGTWVVDVELEKNILKQVWIERHTESTWEFFLNLVVLNLVV